MKPPKLPTVVPGLAAIVTVKCPFDGIAPEVDHAPLARRVPRYWGRVRWKARPLLPDRLGTVE